MRNHNLQRLRRRRPQFERLEQRLVLAAVVWNSDTDGDWDAAANWLDEFSVNRVPGPTDDVTIDRGAANPVVTIRRGDQSVKSLVTREALVLSAGRLAVSQPSSIQANFEFQAGTLDADGTLELASSTLWTGGTLTGDAVVRNLGTLIIASGTPTLQSTTLSNAATISQTGGTLILTTAQLQNAATGSYQLASDSGITSTASTFTNEGTLRKTAGSGTSTVAAAINNPGTIEVQSGTVSLTGAITQHVGSTLTGGTWIIGAGATLNFTTGSNITTNQASVTLDGPGSTFAKINSLSINAGTFSLQAGRDFAGIGNITNSGTLIVGDGSDFAPGPFHTLSNSGTVRKSAGLSESIIPRLVNSGGTVAVLSGTLTLQDGSGTGGVWDVSAGAVLNPNGTSASSTYSGSFSGLGAGVVRVSAGTLFFGSGGLTLDLDGGGFEWNGGNLGSDNGINGLNNRGLFTISGSADRQLNGPITNSGTLTFNGSGKVLFSNATIDNQTAGVIDLQGDGSVFIFGNPPSVIRNSGILRKSAGTGESRITTTFNNLGGTIDVRVGTLTLAPFLGSGDSTGGAFMVAGGAVLDLTGGTGHTLTGTYTATGAGRVQHSAGTLTIGTAGATFNFADIPFTWLGGTINNTGGLTNLGRISIFGTSDKTLNGQLTNVGVIEHTGTGSILFNVATINNQTGGLLDFQSDASLFLSNGPSSIQNSGIVRKSAGNGTSLVTVPFNNLGAAIQVESGTLVLDNSRPDQQRSSSTGGSFNVKPGATLDLVGDSNSVYTGAYTGSGGGRVLVSAGTIDTATAGAIFNFPSPMLQWTGGTIRSNFSSLTNLGSLTVTGSSSKILNSVTLINRGTVVHAGSGSLSETAASIVNEANALYDLQSDADLTSLTQAQGLFNSGRIRKSAGTGTSLIDFGIIDDPGSRIEVSSGTLQLALVRPDDQRSEHRDTTFDVATGATLDLTGGKTATFSGRQVASGGGTVLLDGTVTIGAGGTTFEFSDGMLQWTGGTIDVTNGTLTNLSTINISGTNTKRIAETSNDPDISLINRGSIIHSGSGNLQTQFATLNNEVGGVWELRSDASILAGFSSEIINNSGVFRKAGGTENSNVTVRLNNIGVVDARSGTLTATTVNQASDGTLTGGTWHVSNAILAMPNAGDLTINQGNITLDGPNSVFTNIANLASNGGTFSIKKGRDFTTVGNFTNSGIVSIGVMSKLRVNGNYTQASMLAVEIAGSPARDRHGRLIVSGTASLDGVFRADFSPDVDYTPQVGDSFQVMTFGSPNGDFDSYEGLDFGGITFFKPLISPTDFTLSIVSDAADLVVEQVQIPATGIPGQDVTINYTVRNKGTPTTINRWIDSIFLSSDGVLDATDKLIGRVEHAGAVAGLASYSESLSAPLPGVVEGQYRVLVLADTRRLAPDTNRTNNIGVSADTVGVVVPVLTIGEAVSGTVASNQDVYFRLDVQPGRNILLTANFIVATQAEFKVGFEQVPDRSQFGQLAAGILDLEQRLTVGIPPGRYYILVHGRDGAAGGKSFTLRAEAEPFVFQSIGLGRGANVGIATLPLNGTGFIPDTQASLVSLDGVVHPALAMQFSSSRQVFATFDLTDVPVGAYDVRLTRQGESQTLADAFQVVTGLRGQLQTDLVVPASYRVGRPISGLLEYSNIGDTDLVAPILVLSTPAQASLRLGPTGVFTSGELILLAASSDGAAGILRPGQNGRIEFSAVLTTAETAPFELTFKTADATELIDYDAVEQEIRPPDIADAVWDPIYDRFRTEAGPTWGGFVRLMAKFATRVGQQGGRFFSAVDVFEAVVYDSFLQVNSGVSGRVFLEDSSHPLAGALIILANADGSEVNAGLSNADGSFVLPAVAPGTYRIEVANHLLPEPVQVVVPPDGFRSGVEIVALSGGVITGSISQESASAPIQGVSVTARNESGTLFVTTTDANGFYRLSGLPTSIYTVSAGGGSLSEQSRSLHTVSSTNTLRGIDFLLNSATSLRGTVIRAADGALVAGASVLLLHEDVVQRSTTTDDAGSYIFSGLNPGAYTVKVQAVGFAPTEELTNSLPAGSTSVLPQISLVAGASIRITLTDLDEVPVPSAYVELLVGDMEPTRGITDQNGVATFPDLPAGTYQLHINALGFRDLSDTFVVDSGEIATRSYRLKSAGRIRGRVTDDRGFHLSNVPLFVLGLDGSIFDGSTGKDGSYEVIGLPEGTFAISVGNPPGIARQETTLDANNVQRIVNFSLAGVRISGRVLQADGSTPSRGAAVALVDDGEVLVYDATDASGTYEFIGVRPGTFTLVSAHGTSLTAPREVVISDSDAEVADLVLGGLSLKGTVHDESGQPVGGATITLVPKVAPFLHVSLSSITTPDGGFHVQEIPAGDYFLRAQHPGLAVREVEVSVRSGANPIVITLEAGRTITGRISGARDAAPIPQALLRAFDSATQRVVGIALSDATGHYLITDLPAGTYNLVVSEQEHRLREVNGVSVESTTVVQDIKLDGTSTRIVGRVTDTSGQPIAGAIISVINNLREVLLVTSTDFTGAYSMDQLEPGTYALLARSDGYFPAEAGAVTLTDGQTTNAPTVAMIPAGADPDIPIFSDPGFISFLTDTLFVNPPPVEAIGFISIPSGDTDCPETIDLFRRALTLRENHERSFEAWKAAHVNLNTAKTTGIAQVTLQTLDTIGATISAFLPNLRQLKLIGELGGLAELGAEATVLIAQAAPIVAGVEQLIKDFSAALSSEGRDRVDGITGFTAGLLGLLGTGSPFLEFFNVIKESSKLGRVTKALPIIGAIATGVDAMVNAANAWQDFQRALDAPARAEAQYRADVAAFLAALRALRKALDDCAKRKQLTPPNTPRPEDPEPGDTATSTGIRATDPNDIVGPAGFGVAGYIAPNLVLPYTIHFENLAAATAAAQGVTITHRLDPDLDLTAFELGDFGFGDVLVHVPDGRSFFSSRIDVRDTLGVFVDVTAGLNMATGEATWSFMSIDPTTLDITNDALAGFLPPNQTPPAGEGFVSYVVRSKTNLATGTEIRAVASIVFDTNDPINTNQIDPLNPAAGTDPNKEALVTVDSAPPSSSVSPLPPIASPGDFRVSWSGSDDPGGSGIASYDVFVSDNGAPFTLFQSRTFQTSAVFHGQIGHTYGFFSVATDHVGHRQATPAAAQATILNLPLSWRHPIEPADVNDDSFVSPLDALLIINRLNSQSQTNTPLPVPSIALHPAPFFDVSGDGFATAIDALIVINLLNIRVPGGEGELLQPFAFAGYETQENRLGLAPFWRDSKAVRLASQNIPQRHDQAVLSISALITSDTDPVIESPPSASGRPRLGHDAILRPKADDEKDKSINGIDDELLELLAISRVSRSR